MKYQKKPVTVEAFKWTGDRDQEEDPLWIVKAIECGTVWITEGKDDYEPVMNINTLEGIMYAEKGDYIIQGVRGELYSCKPDIFEETYVKVADTDRLSPDEIGNDIHEFLHGGNK